MSNKAKKSVILHRNNCENNSKIHLITCRTEEFQNLDNKCSNN